MPDFFIVIPVLNACWTIDRTIWSVATQTGGLSIHYHVQDGGSTDGTLERIRSWADRLARIGADLPSSLTFTFSSQADGGMYDAIARGFAAMPVGPAGWMGWCNADDTLWPGALEAIGAMGSDLPDVEWAMGWPSAVDALGRVLALQPWKRFPRAVLACGLADGVHWPFVQQESTFWRRSLWDRAGSVCTSMRLAGDWDLWLRFAHHAPLVHLQRQVGAFCFRPGQQSADVRSYRAEIEAIEPQSSRQRRLRLAARPDLTSIEIATPDADGRWRRARRGCRWPADAMVPLLGLSGPAMVRAMKVFNRVW